MAERSPDRPLLILSCPSGIAGNMWLAGLLGLGADWEQIAGVPALLGLGSARLEWRQESDPGSACHDLEVVDIDPAVVGGYEDVLRRAREAQLPADLRPVVESAIRSRRRGDMGSTFAQQPSWGPEFTDTLVDVVGGALAWHLLGRPVVSTAGLVITGTVTLAVGELLGDIPHAPGPCPDPLVTATGAALLREFWLQARAPATAPTATARVRSNLARRHGLAPLELSLFGAVATTESDRLYTLRAPGYDPSA